MPHIHFTDEPKAPGQQRGSGGVPAPAGRASKE